MVSGPPFKKKGIIHTKVEGFRRHHLPHCISSILLSILPLASHIFIGICVPICCRKAKRQLRSSAYLSQWMTEVHWLAARREGGSRHAWQSRAPNTLPEMPSTKFTQKNVFRKAILHIYKQLYLHSACGGARNTLYGNTASCLNARLKDWGFKF